MCRAWSALVFARPDVACITCHRINDKGADLGPALSEIGAKLGKDALYEAILDPSAGIAFGYESLANYFEIRCDEAFGIVVSDTADETPPQGCESHSHSHQKIGHPQPPAKQSFPHASRPPANHVHARPG
jgi:putative heme-binding domain-containing protein